MQDWTQLTDILKHSSLDRETKLMIIDLLSLSNDPELEAQISELVLTWHAADKAIVDGLLEKFDEVKNNYEAQKAVADEEIGRQTLQIADDVKREDRIQQIRQYIETL